MKNHLYLKANWPNLTISCAFKKIKNY